MNTKMNLSKIKVKLQKILYLTSILLACYGFWGCLFPDLTLMKGTYQIVGEEEYQEDTETLFSDIAENRITVTYSSKLWEIIKKRYGTYNDGYKQ